MTATSSLEFCIILFSFLTLFTIITEAQNTPNYLYHFCTNTTNFTSNSPYQANLNVVLSSLASNATPNNINGFYNASAGQAPDEVYGLFLCRGDLSTNECQNCVSFATKDIVQRCPMRKVAIIWYDPCFLRYADTNIFSTMTQNPALLMWNTQNVSVDVNFNQLLVTTITKAATQAAAAPSGAKKIAVKQVNYTWQDTLYVLVQCTPDLSSSVCYRCLQAANTTFPITSNNKRGGRVLFPSCSLHFEMYPFYNETALLAGAPPPNQTAFPPGAPPPNGNGSKRKWIIVGAILSAIVGLLLSISCTYTIWRTKKLEKEESENSQVLELLELGRGNTEDDYYKDNIQGELKPQDFHLICLDTLKEATKHFSDETKLGQGGFGTVYKGTLEDGKEIAVKRLSINSGQGLREFMNEVTLIAKLQHRNLVRLLGCCLEKKEKLLVYEYMPNKSLDSFLFDSRMAVQLDWQRRLDTINGIARGLLYLHEDSRLRIIHRDLKASNILLDYEMNPKISDFGMARIFGGNQIQANTNRIVGTYGYMAPEYAMSGLCSVKSDVFSFGVLLLEIISGRRNGGFHVSEEGESLLTFAWKLWSGGQALELMDPLLAKSSVASEVLKCIHIGLLCVQEDPADRPTMSSVVVMLATDYITLPVPTQPAFSVGRVVVMEATSSNQKVLSVNEITLSNVLPR